LVELATRVAPLVARGSLEMIEPPGSFAGGVIQE
jgi:hypothetical protein